jgi:hypothetical protein
MVLRERLAVKPKLANKRAKPPDPHAVRRALQVIARAKEVSHPDSHLWAAGIGAAYFDAIATGELLLKPHTARRRAGEVARSCPYEDVAAAGLAKVKAAIKAQAGVAAPQPIRAEAMHRVEA